ncbi:hypothetical protein HK102_007618 [Quaeritorhiza haematococci]|nr:hypothetical protein HK102_007618 [Quaeritorhiza haematococci]
MTLRGPVIMAAPALPPGPQAPAPAGPQAPPAVAAAPPPGPQAPAQAAPQPPTAVAAAAPPGPQAPAPAGLQAPPAVAAAPPPGLQAPVPVAPQALPAVAAVTATHCPITEENMLFLLSRCPRLRQITGNHWKNHGFTYEFLVGEMARLVNDEDKINPLDFWDKYARMEIAC